MSLKCAHRCFQVVSEIALSMTVSLSVCVSVCTHMMAARSASASLLHLIAHFSSTLGNVNGGQLTSVTVHYHLYSSHHHPDGKMDNKKGGDIYQVGLRKSEKVKQNTPCCIDAVCLIAFLCAYTH